MHLHARSNPFSKAVFRIPIYGWASGAGLAAALTAVFIFEVPADIVGVFSVFALLIGTRVFWRAGRGKQTGEAPQQEHPNWAAADARFKEDSTGGSGCCH